MAEISFSENYYNSGGTFTITENIEVEVCDLIGDMPSAAMREELDARGELYPDTSEVIRMLIDADEERAILDEMDLGTVIEILGEDDILTEMDDETIQKYAQDNNLAGESTLDDWGTEGLVDELLQRNDIDAILSQIDSEFIQDHMINKRGGFTLEATDTELLLAELGTRKVQVDGTFTVTEEVAKAIFTLSNFVSFIEMSKGGLEGKRFLLPNE